MIVCRYRIRDDRESSDKIMSERHVKPIESKQTSTAARALPDERRYAKRLMLDRIQSSIEWVGSTHLKAYVERNCSWAEYGTESSRSRTMDNWLRALRDQAQDTQDFEFDNEPGKGFRYRALKRDRLSLETANLVLLAERLLKPFLPREHIESGLQALFQSAHAKLHEHEKKCGRTGDAVGALLERIAVDQRGQRLGGADEASAIVSVVTEAILKRRCIEARLQGRKRRLHPYGLLFRDPKYYLLAVDDQELRKAGGKIEALEPEKFQCSRFDQAEVSTASNLVPDAFALTSWLRENYKGVPIRGLKLSEMGPMTLKLRLFVDASSALVQDLKKHPIADMQRILGTGKEREETRLVAENVWPTVELMNWLLARGHRVEVLEPAFLRQRMVDEVASMSRRYENGRSPEDRKSA